MNRSVPYVLLGLLLAAAGCQQNAKAADGGDPEADLDVPVVIDIIVEGEGPGAEDADLLNVEYIGRYPLSQAVFDQNAEVDDDGNPIRPPLAFVLGAGQVIKGWDEGLLGMKVGGERTLTVPWQKAYGAEGNENIGPKADLEFSVKLLEIVRAKDQEFYDLDDLVTGTGREAKEGDKVTIHYRGTYANGLQFDNSRERGEDEGGTPYEFKIGLGHVIMGIDDGIRGMRVGGTRRLRLPPLLVYGPRDSQSISGNMVCFFEIELLKVE